MYEKVLTAVTVIVALICGWVYLDKPTSVDSFKEKLSTVSVPAKVNASPAALPTASVKAPQPSVPVAKPGRSVIGVNGGNTVEVVPSATAVPLCSVTADQANCQPDPTPVMYVECSPGSYYSCDDLELMRQAAREDEEDPMHEAVLATDEFINNVPTTPPAVKQEYVDTCNGTPKAQRTPLLAAICEGAGL